MNTPELQRCSVGVHSETGRLRAVLLHHPGVEIERMNPYNAAHALFNDILGHDIAAREHALFASVLQRWCNVYYVRDILCHLMEDAAVRSEIVSECVNNDKALLEELMAMDSEQLTKALIEGIEVHNWDRRSQERYRIEPLYNLFFTRDASSTVFNEVLINTMSFSVRQRETYVYDTIFRHFFNAPVICAADHDPEARTEGGDIQVVSHDTLCIGESIRTNRKGIEYLAQHFAKQRDHFNIIIQELPHSPESFIHLDMVFTCLGQHHCMMFEPMLHKKGLFENKHTTLVRIDHGNITYHSVDNILTGLHQVGIEMKPVFCGGNDPWQQLREQWHSGANFFALDDDRIIGYRRNTRTIDALDKAGFDILNAEDVAMGTVEMNEYERFVVTFPGSELPRAGGGARCMTMPILRDERNK